MPNIVGTRKIPAQSHIWDINTMHEKEYYCISYNDSLSQKIIVVADFKTNSIILL